MNRSELVWIFEAVGQIGGYLEVYHGNELLHISKGTACWVWKRGDVWARVIFLPGGPAG